VKLLAHEPGAPEKVTTMWDRTEIQRRAERLIGEDRVTPGEMLELIAVFSEDEQEAAQAAKQQPFEVTTTLGYTKKSADGASVTWTQEGLAARPDVS
jgi:hypothetical protein